MYSHSRLTAMALISLLALMPPKPAFAKSFTTVGNVDKMSFIEIYRTPWSVQPSGYYVSQPVVGLRQFGPSLGTLTAIIATISTYFVQGSGVTGYTLIAPNRPHDIHFSEKTVKEAPVVLELSLTSNSVNPRSLWQTFGRYYEGCGGGPSARQPCSFGLSHAMGPASNNYATKESADILPTLDKLNEVGHFIGSGRVAPTTLSMLLRYPGNVQLDLTNLNSGEARIHGLLSTGATVELTYVYSP